MNVKEIRTATGLSQSKFARKYNISINTLQAWEGGRRTPTEYTRAMLERIALEDVKRANNNH